MKGLTTRELDMMLDAYIGAALWSTNDESTPDGGEPLDKNYGREDLTEATLAAMRSDVTAFAEAHAPQIDGDWGQAGHDFWLTRNGHGAGFWDGDWPEPAATMLTEASKAFGEFYLFVGDNGEIDGHGSRNV